MITTLLAVLVCIGVILIGIGCGVLWIGWRLHRHLAGEASGNEAPPPFGFAMIVDGGVA